MGELVDAVRDEVQLWRIIGANNLDQLQALHKAMERTQTALEKCSDPHEIENALLQEGAIGFLDSALSRTGWEKLLTMEHRTPATLRGFATHLRFYYHEDELADALRAEANQLEHQIAQSPPNSPDQADPN